jgi:hypothetical protein
MSDDRKLMWLVRRIRYFVRVEVVEEIYSVRAWLALRKSFRLCDFIDRLCFIHGRGFCESMVAIEIKSSTAAAASTIAQVPRFK